MNAPVPYSSVEQFFERPYLATTYTWTSVSTATSVNPFSYLASITAYKNKLDNYTGFRGDAVLTYVLSGSPFHYGRLACGHYCYLSVRGNNLYVADKGVMQLPHVLLDPSSDCTVQQVIPFIATMPYINLQNQGVTSLSALASVTIYPIVPLASANAATPTSVTLSVYVSFKNIQLVGRTAGLTTVTGRKVVIPANSSTNERKKPGAVETASSALIVASGILEDVPLIGPIAKGVGVVAGAVRSVASFFGFSKPSYDEPIALVRATAVGAMSPTDGKDTSLSLSRDSNQASCVDPVPLGFSSEDQMSFAYIKSQWGYLGATTISDTTSLGNFLHIVVAPQVTGQFVDANYKFIPSIAMLGGAHRYWRGSLEYRFVIVTSPLIRGRLQFRHTPAIASSTAYSTIAEDKCVYELGNTNVVDVMVPHTSTNEWNDIPLGPPGLYSASLPTNTGGTLSVDLVSPISTQFSPINVTILVYVRGGPDLEFNEYIGLNKSIYKTMLTSRTVDLTKASPVPVKCTVGTPSMIAPMTSAITFGEPIQSLRTLMKRAEFLYSTDIGDPTGSTLLSGWGTLLLYIQPYNWNFVASALTNTFLGYPSASAFAWCYYGAKGGVRYRVIPWNKGVVGTIYNPWPNAPVFVSRGDMTTTALIGDTWDTPPYPLTAVPEYSYFSLNHPYGVEAYSLDTGYVDVQLPDMSPIVFRPNKNNIQNNLSDTANQTQFQNVRVDIPAVTQDNDLAMFTTRAEVFVSMADDFSFLGWYGPPLIRFT